MFGIVVITLPYGVENEAERLDRLAARPEIGGLHLRKPSFTESEMRAFLSSLTENTLRKARIHSHYTLFNEFPLQGIHLSSGATAPELYTGRLSASCHSLDEVRPRLRQGCDYVFLSPIFDSISKPGYKAAFSYGRLRQADLSGVVALGGVTPAKIPLLQQIGFAGAALSGYIWNNPESDNMNLNSDSNGKNNPQTLSR